MNIYLSLFLPIYPVFLLCLFFSYLFFEKLKLQSKLKHFNAPPTPKQIGLGHETLKLFLIGLKVRAFVRDPSKLPEDLKSKVEVFQGNVLEPDSVRDAIDGTDGVVIALGTRSKLEATSDLSEGTKNIIDAMRSLNIKNVSVCLSAFLFYEAEKVPPIFVELTKDHKRMYDALRESPLNYVAVFPPHFTGMFH